MRFVKVPEPIQVKNLSTGEPITVDGSTAPWRLHRYLLDIILPDAAFGKGYKADRVRAAICKAFRDAKPGEYVPVEDEHHDMLKAVVEEPESNISPIVSMQMFPFQEALMEAPREMPKVLAEVTG